jgi:hypothetical protein
MIPQSTPPALRADPLGDDIDLSGFTPTLPKNPKIEKDMIRAVSEQNNFPSRAPETARAIKTKPLQRRRRTGRNVQFNIKATATAIERFTALADRNQLVFGELLDLALDAFEQMHPGGKCR